MAPSAPSMAVSNGTSPVFDRHIYEDDVVSLKRKPARLGLVTRIFHNPESDDDDDETPVPKDQALLCWYNGTSEVMEKLTALKLEDRYFELGCTVARYSDPLAQSGQIANMRIVADLDRPGLGRLCGIDTSVLRHVRTFQPGEFVVRGDWLGRIDAVLDTVVVLFSDGAKCQIERVHPDLLTPIQDMATYDSASCPYYPGQKVVPASSSVFKTAVWLNGAWKPSRATGRIVSVKEDVLFVTWTVAGGRNQHSLENLTPPPNMVGIQGLVPLAHLFRFWTFGDRCLPMLDVKDCEQLLSASREEQEGQEQSVAGGGEAWQQKKKRRSGKRGPSGGSVGFVAVGEGSRSEEWSWVLARTQTFVDVVWQNGVEETCISAIDLLPKEFMDGHDLFPGEFVETKAPDGGTGGTGVVLRVDAKQMTAVVRWLDDRGNDASATGSSKCGEEEIVSVYELSMHSVHNFHIGDTVIRIEPAPLPGGTETETGVGQGLMQDMEALKDAIRNLQSGYQPIGPAETGGAGAEGAFEPGGTFGPGGFAWETGSADVASPDESAPADCPPWAGQVLRVQEGMITVGWSDRSLSEVGPTEIYTVHQADMSDFYPGDEMGAEDAVSLEAASWETVDSKEEEEEEEEEEEGGWEETQGMEGSDVGMVEEEEEEEEVVGDRGKLLTPTPAPFLRRVQDNIASFTFAPLARLAGGVMAAGARVFPGSTANSQAGGGGDASEGERVGESVEGEGGREPSPPFASVSNPEGHAFVEERSQSTNRKWAKRVQYEWGILAQHLPEGMWVRVYEDRMDLLRAAMVGPAGTPYHHNLLIFDIWLPPDYPHVPPSVHFRSFGLRLNPNLYECGKVCLSLINTWQGLGVETWNPNFSTLLQVLVSIQGLVLVPKPYFNEAGYDRQTGTLEGERNSIVYNESAFILCCKYVLYLLRKPPMHFEELVKMHFRERASLILDSCHLYCEGALVGSLSEHGGAEIVRGVMEGGEKSSQGFRLVLTKLVPKLEEALELNKVGCDLGSVAVGGAREA